MACGQVGETIKAKTVL